MNEEHSLLLRAEDQKELLEDALKHIPDREIWLIQKFYRKNVEEETKAEKIHKLKQC